jgi:hypothetical protein
MMNQRPDPLDNVPTVSAMMFTWRDEGDAGHVGVTEASSFDLFAPTDHVWVKGRRRTMLFRKVATIVRHDEVESWLYTAVGEGGEFNLKVFND